MLVPCNQSKIMGFKTVWFQTFKSCCGTLIIYTLCSTAQWNSDWEKQHLSSVLFLKKISIFQTKVGSPWFQVMSDQRIVQQKAATLNPSFVQAVHHVHSHFTMVTCSIPTTAPAPAVKNSWHSIYLAELFERAGRICSSFTLHFTGRHYALRKRCKSTNEN